jgi:hypothetical protein
MSEMKPVKKRDKPVLCYIQTVNRMNTAKFDLLQRFGVNRGLGYFHGVDHDPHDLLHHRLIKKKSTGDFPERFKVT